MLTVKKRNMSDMSSFIDKESEVGIEYITLCNTALAGGHQGRPARPRGQVCQAKGEHRNLVEYLSHVSPG